MSEEKEIRCDDTTGNQLSGSYTVIGDVITVTAANGRQLRTHLGNTPAEAAAKMLLRELARQKPD
jgi:hypothetical protein